MFKQPHAARSKPPVMDQQRQQTQQHQKGMPAVNAPSKQALQAEQEAADLLLGPSAAHDSKEEQDGSMRLTAGIAMGSVLLYILLSRIVQAVMQPQEAAIRHQKGQVPDVLYQITATAFFTAFVLNLTSFLFEDSVAKRQLALLSCTIKGVACYADLLMVSEAPLVLHDKHGVVMIPQRYVQWLVTTPLMVIILSRMSDFTVKRTAITAGADAIMIMLGFTVHLTPAPFHWIPFLTSCGLFVFVMRDMGAMVFSAVRASAGWSGPNTQRSLVFIFMCTLLVWSLFPISFLMGLAEPAFILRNEIVTCLSNFTAKVLFSSSIMYGNYMTITQRMLMKKAEEENKARIQMVRDLKEAVTRKDHFMSLMSHELRTPLNGIIHMSDALFRGQGGGLTEKGMHHVTTIRNSSNHLLNIINDILDVAALKEGKLAIKHDAVNLQQAVTHVIDILQPLAKKDVKMDGYVDPKTPIIVADFSRIVQVLYNLMGNSLKFTKAGHVHVRVEPKNRANGAEVVIKVEDTGIGIPKHKIPDIWGAFEQVDMSVTRKYGGTGLGLNIVKQLVSSHEGSITCDSVEGKGTNFTITLPVLQRDIRPSLEEQVHTVAKELGYDWDKLVKSLSTTLPDGPRRNSTSLCARGVTSRDGFSQAGSTVVSAASNIIRQMTAGRSIDEPEGGERETLIKRRTLELEREAMTLDLHRRAQHERSMEKEREHVPKSSDNLLPPPPASVNTKPSSTSNLRQSGPAVPVPNTPQQATEDSRGRTSNTSQLRRPVSRPLLTVPPPGAGSATSPRNRSQTLGGNGCEEDDISLPMRPPGRSGAAYGTSHAGEPPFRMSYAGAGRHYSTNGAANRSQPLFPLARGQSYMMGQSSVPSLNGCAIVSQADDEDEENKYDFLASEKVAYSQIHHQKILILSVDDEEVNQSVIETVLDGAEEDYEYVYARADDGEEALEWLRTHEYLPDLILLDCMMPNMSGHDVLQILRRYIPANQLPVIMVSAKSDEGNIVNGLRNGSNDFVRKPFVREELLARIRSQVDTKRLTWWQLECTNDQGPNGYETPAMKLLKNILPDNIIKRMQAGLGFVADAHQHVVILFSDIVGFTNMSSQLPTSEVFMMLSNLFGSFDKLTDKFSVYKVETIGDAYMVAAGHDEDPAKAKKGTPIERVVEMAKAMIDVVQNLTTPRGEKVQIRVGIHCGPAFAGVIGSKCPRYCFLGDTVNTASRMESLSFPMCVQLSSQLVDAWPDAETHAAFLGERPVKGKGVMTTYLLKHGDWVEGQKLFEAQSCASAALSELNTQKAIVLANASSTGSMLANNSVISVVVDSEVANSGPRTTSNPLFEDTTMVETIEGAFVNAPPTLQPVSSPAFRQQLEQMNKQLALQRDEVTAARQEAELEKLRSQKAMSKVNSILANIQQWQKSSGIPGVQPSNQSQSLLVEAGSSTAHMQGCNPVRPVSLQLGVASWAGSGRVTGPGSSALVHLAKATANMPAMTLSQLCSELGLDSYIQVFETQAVRLDQLLGLEVSALQALGITPAGHCLRLRGAVLDLAKSLLHLCEERGLRTNEAGKAVTMTELAQ